MKKTLSVAMIFLIVLSTLSMLTPQTKAEPDQGTWVQKADMPTPRKSMATVTLEDKIYVIGGTVTSGYGDTTPTDIVEIYDPTTDSWTTGTSTPISLYSARGVVVQNKIYVLNHDNNRVFCYDSTSDTWTEVAPIPCPLENGRPRQFGVGAVGGKIYVAKGESPPEEGWTYSYNPLTDTWSDPLSPIPYPHRMHSFVGLSDKLYAIGGSDPNLGARIETNQVDVYDPKTDSWEIDAIPRMSYHRGKPSVSVMDGKIYVVGGWNGYHALSSMEVYDPATNSWTIMAPMSIGRYWLATAVVDGKLYAIGGDYGGHGGHLQSLNEEFTPPSPPPELYSLPAGAKNIDPTNPELDETRLLIDIDIDGQGQTAYVDPGETVSGSLTYQIYSGAGNPAEINQGFFTMSWTPSWPAPSGYHIPIWNGISGVHPGVTNTESFSFTVPSTLGTYYLYWCGGAEYSMADAVVRYDQQLTLPAHAKIVVEEIQEPAAILSASPTIVDISESVTFNASASYDPNGGVEYYWFDYGDDSYSGWISSSTSIHTYSESGVYYARVKVKDNDGLESEWSEPIKITADYIHLAEQYFPYLIFDADEQYFPTDFYYDDENINNNPSNYDKSWPKSAYVHTVYDHETEWLTIEYWFYYVRDSKAWNVDLPPPFPECWLAHDHDWESIYVFLAKQGADYIPSRVTYFKHQSLDINIRDYYVPNSWDSWWVEKKEGIHPVVYTALSSHASYQRMVPVIEIGLPLYYLPEGDKGIPIPEPVDGGLELSFDDFEVIYASTPDQSWPEEKFGDCIDAPWNRARWDDPWYAMTPTVIKNSLFIAAESPVNLLAIDPSGQRVGWDPETETEINEIYGAIYSGVGSEPQAIFIPDPLCGAYESLVVGTATGTYTLTLQLITPEGSASQTYTGGTVRDRTDYYSTLISETGEMEVISWEYVFEDAKRGTMLKVSTDDKYFQFVAPDKEFAIKEACKMKVCSHSIFIWHKDDEIKLVTIAIDTRIDFCFAFAKGMETGDRYLLIDKPGTE